MSPARAIAPLHGSIDATVRLPGSKSLTNRALVCAALAEGTSTLRGALHSEDTDALIESLRRLGVLIAEGETSADLIVESTGSIANGPISLDARMSGTTSRFLLPLLATGQGVYTLDGHDALRRRPMGGLAEALESAGADVAFSTGGHLPARIDASGLVGGFVEVAGDVSSQFLSGLLLSGPKMAEGVDVIVTTPLVSLPYVEMTADVMERFGAHIEGQPEGRHWVVHPEPYLPTEIDIEPDASAASYFFAAAALVGGRVRVTHLDASSVQGDIRFVEILAEMGAEVTYGDGWTEVRSGRQLRGVSVDMSDISDTVQTLAVMAPFCSTPTEITGVGFIRGKETNRLEAVVTELRRCGVDAIETEDGLRIEPGPPEPARIRTYDDHRMAMSFALIGLRSAGIEICDPECVAKTFPTFWDELGALGAES